MGDEKVDLNSTLQVFGQPGFEALGYASKHFAHTPVDSVHQLYEELLERKTLTARALKSYVTEHYDYFIKTAKKVQSRSNEATGQQEGIEADVSRLHNLLFEYREAIQSLAEVSFSAEEVINENKELGGHVESGEATRGIKEASVEESVGELASLIAERQFENALAIIETGKRLDCIGS